MDMTLIVNTTHIMWYSPAVPRNLIMYHKQMPCLNFSSRKWPYAVARHKAAWQFDVQASYMEQVFRFGWQPGL